MASPIKPAPDPRNRAKPNTILQAASATRLDAPDLTPLAKAADSLQRLGLAIQAEKEQADRLADRINFAKASAVFQSELDARLEELDPAAGDYEQRVREIVANARDSARERFGFVTDEARQLFEVELTTRGERAVLASTVRRREVLQRQAAVELDQLASSVQNQIIANPGEVESILAGRLSELDALVQALPAEARAKARQSFETGVHLAVVEGLAIKGQYDAANRYLRSPATQSIDPDILRGMERRIVELKNRAEADFLRASARQLAELRYKVAIGEAGFDEIMDAKRRGLFNQREGAEYDLLLLSRNVEEARLKNEARKMALLSGVGLVDKGTPANAAVKMGKEKPPLPTYPTTQKEVDDVWDAFTGGSVDLRTDQALAASFVSELGAVPSDVKNFFNTAAASQDAEALASAAALNVAIRAVRPGLDTGAPVILDYVAAMADLYKGDFRKAAEGVVDMVRTNGGLTVNQKNTRIAEASKNIKWAEAVEETLGGYHHEAERELRKLFDGLVALGADPAMALKVSQGRLKALGFGETRVGGVPSVQNFVPENWFPPAAMAYPKEMRAAIVNHEIGKLLNDNGIELMDPKDIRALAGQALPPWRLRLDEGGRFAPLPAPIVEILTPFGTYVPVKDANGRPVRWRPPTLAEFQETEIFKRFESTKQRRGFFGLAPAQETPADALRSMVSDPDIMAEMETAEKAPIPALGEIEADRLALVGELEENGLYDKEVQRIIDEHATSPEKWAGVRSAVDAYLAKRNRQGSR